MIGRIGIGDTDGMKAVQETVGGCQSNMTETAGGRRTRTDRGTEKPMTGCLFAITGTTALMREATVHLGGAKADPTFEGMIE